MSRKDPTKPGRDPIDKPCMTPGCKARFGGPVTIKNGKKVHRGGRGLCYTCHGAAMRLIKRGKTTWDELVELKLALPKAGSRLEEALLKRRTKKPIKELPPYPSADLNETLPEA